MTDSRHAPRRQAKRKQVETGSTRHGRDGIRTRSLSFCRGQIRFGRPRLERHERCVGRQDSRMALWCGICVGMPCSWAFNVVQPHSAWADQWAPGAATVDAQRPDETFRSPKQGGRRHGLDEPAAGWLRLPVPIKQRLAFFPYRIRFEGKNPLNNPPV